MQRPDWKNSVMREWKRPPTMIVHGLYPLISRVSVAERSMIVLLVIEYLCSMLPEDLSVTMEGPWFSHGDLDDLASRRECRHRHQRIQHRELFHLIPSL